MGSPLPPGLPVPPRNKRAGLHPVVTFFSTLIDSFRRGPALPGRIRAAQTGLVSDWPAAPHLFPPLAWDIRPSRIQARLERGEGVVLHTEHRSR